MALTLRGSPAGLRASAAQQQRVSRMRLVCKAQLHQQEKPAGVASRLALAGLAASIMLSSSAMMPDEALAARSSGRVGGSSGFAARKAPPSRFGIKGSSATRRGANPAIPTATPRLAARTLSSPMPAPRQPSARGTSSGVQSSRTVVNNSTVLVAPPVVSPFGFGGFGFGGFSIMPTFVMPFPFFGGLFQLFFLFMIVSVVFSVIRGLASGGDNKSNKKDDWGDL